MKLTQAKLKTWLRYDPKTGLFFWIKEKSRVRVGMQAGYLTSQGYIRITVDGRRYMAHVLAWLYVTGVWCPRGIDHKDTVGSNNAWTNLRRATSSQNAMNRKCRSDNPTGIKGARLKNGKTSKPYYSTISVDRNQRHLGYFDTAEEAAAAYAAAAIKNHGEFARVA